ncbi:MAG: hypothetical protein M1820_010754, partial [Bogoriella megaspora]
AYFSNGLRAKSADSDKEIYNALAEYFPFNRDDQETRRVLITDESIQLTWTNGGCEEVFVIYLPEKPIEFFKDIQRLGGREEGCQSKPNWKDRKDWVTGERLGQNSSPPKWWR